MAAKLYALLGVEMAYECEQVQWPGGKNVKVGWDIWYQTINLYLLYFLMSTRISYMNLPRMMMQYIIEYLQVNREES